MSLYRSLALCSSEAWGTREFSQHSRRSSFNFPQLSMGKPSFSYSTAAAKSLQLCPALCDPIDGSPPGSPIPGILQARTLEWVAISFTSAWKWKVKVKSLSRVWLLVTPWTAAHQASPSMGFSRQEFWSGLPLPSLIPTSIPDSPDPPGKSQTSLPFSPVNTLVPHFANKGLSSTAMVFPVVRYGCESWTIKKLSAEKLMLLNCGIGENSWESLGLQDPTSPS